MTRERIERRRIADLEQGRPIRADDEASRKRSRREAFETQTWDAVREAAEVGKLIVIDARKSPDEVHEQVMTELAWETPRPLEEVFQEVRGWTDREEQIPTDTNESRMERR